MRAKTTIIRLLCLLLCLTGSIGAFAQVGRTITGTVVDELETPLPGVSVIVMKDKKMLKGASTGIDGEFKIDLMFSESEKLTLVFSYMGSKTQTYKLTEQNIGKPFNIRLTPDDAMLEEVTIVEDG